MTTTKTTTEEMTTTTDRRLAAARRRWLPDLGVAGLLPRTVSGIVRAYDASATRRTTGFRRAVERPVLHRRSRRRRGPRGTAVGVVVDVQTGTTPTCLVKGLIGAILAKFKAGFVVLVADLVTMLTDHIFACRTIGQLIGLVNRDYFELAVDDDKWFFVGIDHGLEFNGALCLQPMHPHASGLLA